MSRGLSDLADPMGLGSLGALCQPEAIEFCKKITLPRGEPWHWVKCGTVAGNLCHWLLWNTRGVEPENAWKNIASGIRKLYGMGNISGEEAIYLWQQIGGFSGTASEAVASGGASAGGGAGAGGSSSSSSSSSAGGFLPSSILSASIAQSFSAVPVYVWYGLGALFLVVMLKGRR